MSTSSQPIIHIVAGPDGSGKSTFTLRHLPRWAGDVAFVNPAPEALPSRIRHRVLSGANDVPHGDVMRRFDRSVENIRAYANQATRTLVFDARPPVPELIWRRNGTETAFDPKRAAK